ncbi:MAG: hypothetical protein ACFFDH_00395 [Promethearchaeota archaeon]
MKNEKINKENKILYKYLANLLMNRFIKFVDDFGSKEEYFKYKSNIQFAIHFKDKLDRYFVNFLNLFISLDKLKNITENGIPIYEINELLNSIKNQCFTYKPFKNKFGGIYIFKTLNEQNEFSKTGYHFDYSSKNPNDFGSI